VKSLEEWDKVRSTKVDTLVTLLAWHLESDSQTTFNIEDWNTNTAQGADLQTAVNVEEPIASALDANPMDQSDGYVPQQSNNTITGKVNARYVEMLDLMTMGKRKILVYMEFPMMAPLLVSVLQLYNIVPLIIHGGHGIDERNETVQKFSTDPAARILIFSNVGALGLNLTAASIVILFVSLTHLDDLYVWYTDDKPGPMLVAHACESDHWTCMATRPNTGGPRLQHGGFGNCRRLDGRSRRGEGEYVRTIFICQ
jgi:hypothetical protein